MDPKFQQLHEYKEGAYLQGILPYVEDYINRRVKVIENRVFLASDKGELTLEGALSAWMEVKALRRLVKGMDQKVAVAIGIGEEVMPKELKPEDYTSG